MAISIARRIAFETLLRTEAQAAYADDWLHARLAAAKLKREDAALATELVMGTLRWQRLLDFLLEPQLAKQHPTTAPDTPAVARLDAEVRAALRLGLYQLRWLERVPARAAVHESVELVKRARKASAAGLVNAVLRRLASETRTPEEQLLPRQWPLAERLAVLGSHPTWLAERWLAALGEEETRALLAANNSPPRVTCALAAGEKPEAAIAELKKQGVEARPGRWLRDALQVVGGAVGQTRAFAEGRVRIQDEASQMVARLPGAQPGMRVLDVCAAPGGKTLVLAEAVGASGCVVAADLHAHRLQDMRDRLAPHPNVHRLAMDASAPHWPLMGEFDAILVDVPCSGTGTLARHPEIRWRLRPDHLADLRAKQTAILLHAAARLRPGGRLVYSTCSLEPEENEQVVEAVLAQRPELRMAKATQALQEHLRDPAAVSALFDQRGFFRTWPQRHATDGFFAAVLEHKGG